MHIVAAAVAGVLFGTGLVLAGFVNPAVVLGFLDVFGAWNPALLFGMAGALAVALPGYRLVTGRQPLLTARQELPSRRDIDAPLVAGAVLFGLGWGLAGICPGPAVTMVTLAPGPALLFLAAMAAGMVLHRLTRGMAEARPRPAGPAGAADG